MWADKAGFYVKCIRHKLFSTICKKWLNHWQMFQKFKNFLHLGPLHLKKLLKFWLSLDKSPCLNAGLPHALLHWLIADLSKLHSSSPVDPVGSLSVWPGRLLPWIRHAQGLSSGLERYKICSVPLPIRKPISKQDLETSQVSITESAETQLHVPQNISKGIPPHVLEKKWVLLWW